MKHWRKVVVLGFALCGLPAVLGPSRDPATGEPYRFLARPNSYTDQLNKSFLSLKPERIGVIGGHMAGCVAAKTLLQQGFRVHVFEQHVSLSQNPTRGDWSLPDFPSGLETKGEFLQRYVDEFALQGSLQMGCQVLSVAQQPNGAWTVSTPDGSLSFDFLIVAGGFRTAPTPRFASSYRFNGQIYANEPPPYDLLAGKEVVVIGPQDTAAGEIQKLCAAGAKVVYVFPKGESVRNRSWLTDWLQGTRVGELEAKEEMNKTLAGVVTRGVDVLYTYLHNLMLPTEVQVPSYAKARLGTSALFDFTPFLSSKQLTILRGSVSNTDDNHLFVEMKKVRCDAVVLTPRVIPNSFGLLGEGSGELYRGTIKPGLRNAAFLGLFSGPTKLVLTSLQAKWLLDVLRGRVLLPSEVGMKMQAGGGEGYALADAMMQDCGIEKHRRATWMREWVEKMKAEDYREVVTHSK